MKWAHAPDIATREYNNEYIGRSNQQGAAGIPHGPTSDKLFLMAKHPEPHTTEEETKKRDVKKNRMVAVYCYSFIVSVSPRPCQDPNLYSSKKQ